MLRFIFAIFITSIGSILVAGGVQRPIANVNALPESSTLTAQQQGPSGPPPNPAVPYFDYGLPERVTSVVGKSAYLSCRVRNLGNKTVSWIRHKDVHILTVGAYTYTSDQRYQTNYHPQTDEWVLQIKWAQERDSGVYECQISTAPVLTFSVTLHVVVPTAKVLGGPEMYVNMGSTINVTCSIDSPEPPAYIFWYHEDEIISYDSSRGGVSVITEKGDNTTSFLLIQNAKQTDSGRYTCSPSNAEISSIQVHVLNGERPAAMQTGTAGLSSCSFSIFSMLIIPYILNSLMYTVNPR